MRLTVARFVLAAVAVLAASLGAASLRAMAEGPLYPDRPWTMVVTFTAGGSSDVLARAVADAMSRGLGKQVAVDNRPGAGGHIGAESVAHAAPDGYTILFGTNGTLGIGPALYKNLRYDPERDLAPIGILARAAVAADQRLRRSQTLRNDRDGVLAAPGALPQRSRLN